MFEVFCNLQCLRTLGLNFRVCLSDQVHQDWEMLVKSLLLGDNSWKLSHQWMADVCALIDQGSQELGNLVMIKVLVNVLSIEFCEKGFPKFIALKVQLSSAGCDLSKCISILNREYVDIFDCDGDNDWVHGIIDFNVMVNDVLVDGGNLEIKEILDVVL